MPSITAVEKQLHTEGIFATLPSTPLESLTCEVGQIFRAKVPPIARFLAGEPLISESHVRELLTDAGDRIAALAHDFRGHHILGPFISKVENSLEEWMRNPPSGEKLLEVRMSLGPLFNSPNLMQSNDRFDPLGAAPNGSGLFTRLEYPRESSGVLYLVNFNDLPALIERVKRLSISTLGPRIPNP